LFKSRTRDVSLRAEQYLKGLFQAKKKNMERMAETVPNTNDQAYQHFLSTSPWEEEAVIDQHCRDTNQLIGGKKDSCLLIDETAFPKKGRNSVGVSHQYCGQKGKIDNCQVGVFAVLAHQHHVAPLDGRLFLPKPWIDDRERCRSVGVPEEFIEYQRKQDLALQLVISARLRGVEFNWIGFDALYGSDPGFLRFLNDMGEIFVGDIRGNQRIYLEDPKPFIPAQESKWGRRPTRLKTNIKPIRVDRWAEQQDDEAWERLNVRDSSKGRLKVTVLHRRVWLWDGKESQAQSWRLIVRKAIGADKTKYSISNASFSISLERLAYMQGQRYLVERVFQDAKDQCGMGQYQARGWRSWHHHMTMVMLAMQFMLSQQLNNSEDLPLLSSNDIVELLTHYLPNRKATEEEIFEQLQTRHLKRQRAIESAYRKQFFKDHFNPD
jgi:SRSO17 transposase